MAWHLQTCLETCRHVKGRLSITRYFNYHAALLGSSILVPPITGDRVRMPTTKLCLSFACLNSVGVLQGYYIMMPELTIVLRICKVYMTLASFLKSALVL